MSSTAQVFNALSGPELVKAILADIEKKLQDTGEFGAHVTFPWVKYDYSVSLVVYPKQAVDAEPGIVVESKGGTGIPLPGDATADTLKDVKVSDSVIVDTPDLARLASDQPLPTTAKGPGNVLVDKMVNPAAPKTDRKPFGYKGTDGKGKDGTGNQSNS